MCFSFPSQRLAMTDIAAIGDNPTPYNNSFSDPSFYITSFVGEVKTDLTRLKTKSKVNYSDRIP